MRRVGAARWDRQTFATWVQRNTRTAGARAFWATYTQGVFAAEPQDFSLLHALFVTHSGGGVSSVLGVRNGAQQDRIVGGSALLATRMAAALDDALVLDAPVRSIEQRAADVVVRGDAVCVRARRAIVAVPPALASRIAYTPVLPGLRDQLTQKMPAGSVIKINVAYPAPFWRARGLSGQAVGDQAPISFTFDNTPADGRARRARVLPRRRRGAPLRASRPEDRRLAVLASLRAYFGPEAAKPIEYVELDWSAEEWTRGCYGAHLAPGVWTQFGAALREPVGRIHWAGTETAPAWNGYMDGAITSGERAAAEVLARA